tara:strand:+ start:79 stop:195 length:117 start_codon:yes stop_codon:yes gene_type:complete
VTPAIGAKIRLLGKEYGPIRIGQKLLSEKGENFMEFMG